LLLIAEDFAAVRIDKHFQPVAIVGAVFLVIAKSFDAGKIRDPLAFGIEERLIDAEVVRVAVDITRPALRRR